MKKIILILSLVLMASNVFAMEKRAFKIFPNVIGEQTLVTTKVDGSKKIEAFLIVNGKVKDSRYTGVKMGDNIRVETTQESDSVLIVNGFYFNQKTGSGEAYLEYKIDKEKIEKTMSKKEQEVFKKTFSDFVKNLRKAGGEGNDEYFIYKTSIYVIETTIK